MASGLVARVVPLYWSFLLALVINSIYPSILLHSPSKRVQRDAVAAGDVFLDLTYFLTSFISGYFAFFG